MECRPHLSLPTLSLPVAQATYYQCTIAKFTMDNSGAAQEWPNCSWSIEKLLIGIKISLLIIAVFIPISA